MSTGFLVSVKELLYAVFEYPPLVLPCGVGPPEVLDTDADFNNIIKGFHEIVLPPTRQWPLGSKEEAGVFLYGQSSGGRATRLGVTARRIVAVVRRCAEWADGVGFPERVAPGIYTGRLNMYLITREGSVGGR